MLYNAYSNEAAVMAANYHDIINEDLFFAGLANADPEPLKELWSERRWAVHRKKIPFNPLSGKNAKSNDPGSCVNFRDAYAALDDYDGVEVLLGNGLCGIDLDHCIDPDTGRVDPEALQVVDTLNSYAEISPSGTGIHILARGEMPFTGRQGSRSASLQIEMYSESRFLTITGDAINDKPIADRTAEIKALADQYFPASDPNSNPETTSAPLDPNNDQQMILSALEAIDPIECDYMQWIRIGVGLKEAGLGADVWDDWSSRDPDRYKPGECSRKWDTFRDQGQNSNGSGIIIAIAKENGWEPGEAFDEDEKDDYFRSKALAELQNMQHLSQATDEKSPAGKDNPPSISATPHAIDAAMLRDQTLSAAELVNMELPMPEFFVENLLPEGATILAGPSKIGKSLLAMDLANKICLGEDFLGRPTHQAAVMVYSLEDSFPRLKDRLIKQGHVYADPAHSPQYRISAKRYYDGLKEEIQSFIEDNGRSLIILDTLQLVTPTKTGKVSEYDFFYPFLSDISNLAREGHSSIVLIHHTTKAIDENNPFNNILGSTALQGATDAMIIISRTKKQLSDNKATLHFTGRDVPMDEIEMAFNKDNLTWDEEEAVEESNNRASYKNDPVMTTIRTIIEEIEDNDGINREYIVTMSDLIQETEKRVGMSIDITPLQCGAAVRKYIDLLAADGIAVDLPQGSSRANGSKPRRYYTFRPID